jgi:3-oxoacyl-[acyl-carrier protein] reductase
LLICSRGGEGLTAAAEDIRSRYGVPVVAVGADLSEERGIREVVDAALGEYGRVDVLVTNTGGPPAGTFVEHSMEVWREAIRQNLESVLGLVRGVLPGMQERGWGRIINVTSIAVKQPVDGLILSNSIRAAVTGFARTLANEVAMQGITVNNVMPGYTRTERLGELAQRIARDRGISQEAAFRQWEAEIPMGRLGHPTELAALVAFLASERAEYITGASIPVDGGWIRALV